MSPVAHLEDELSSTVNECIDLLKAIEEACPQSRAETSAARIRLGEFAFWSSNALAQDPKKPDADE